jgi:hypothetical protein
MNIKKIQKLLFALLIMLSALPLHAQNFLFKSKIEAVPKNGFYKIILSSDINARCNNNLQDLRMMDNDGKEIPFLLKKESSYQQESDFNEYTILENSTMGDWQTLIVENPYKTSIDKLLFEMKNAEADRMVRINGSDDKQKWFVVKDNFSFSSYQNESSANVFNYVTFPLTDYKYYRVEIKIKNKLPLNILKAGYTNTIAKAPSFNQINGLTFTRKDSKKKTTLNFICNPSNRIDKLVFSISAPSLYHRNAMLFKEVEENNNLYESNLGSMKKYKRYLPSSASFEISSDKETVFITSDFLGNVKTNSFIVEISNEDNEPLQLNSIKGYHLVTTISAELKKDKNYFLYFGDSLLIAPSYDIVYFETKISDSVSLLKTGNVLPKSIKEETEYNGNADKYLVWIGLGIVGLLLLFVISNMLKNMKKDEDNS